MVTVYFVLGESITHLEQIATLLRSESFTHTGILTCAYNLFFFFFSVTFRATLKILENRRPNIPNGVDSFKQ
jgi:hypothetical protein